MGVYIEFMKKSFQQRFAYRANSYIHIVSALMGLFVQMSVWSALFSRDAVIKGITFPDMVNYIIISMIIGTLTRSNAGSRIAEKVNNGSIVSDFVRPVKFGLYLFAEDLGENCFRTVFNTLPACIAAVAFWGFRLPRQPVSMLLFLVSITNGIILVYYINYVLGLLAFWFKTSFYVDWILGAFFELFSGTFIPLWFYPDLLYKVSLLLPFRFISFEPLSIYLEKVTPAYSVQVILTQLVWIAFFILLERFIWWRAQSKITVHGG